jgi:hypothetical protein
VVLPKGTYSNRKGVCRKRMTLSLILLHVCGGVIIFFVGGMIGVLTMAIVGMGK